MVISKREIFALIAVVVVAVLACRRTSSGTGAAASATATASAAEPVDASATPEAQKARLTKRVETLEAIAKEKLPPISSKRTLKAVPPKPTLQGWANIPNAAVASLEQLADLRVDKVLPSYVSSSLSWCGAWVRGKKESIDSMYIRDCERFRYVVVIRFLRYVKPKMISSSSYKAGLCVGDATVFDLQTGKRLGSVPFSGTNSDKLDTMQGLEQRRVESDLNSSCTWSAQTEIDEIYGDPTKL